MSSIPVIGYCDSVKQFAKKYNTYVGIVRFTLVHRHEQEEKNGFQFKGHVYIGEHQINSYSGYLKDYDGTDGKAKMDKILVWNTKDSDMTDIDEIKCFVDNEKITILQI